MQTGRFSVARRYRLRSLAVVFCAFAAWSLVAAGTGIFWMVHDAQYVNGVMIPAVVLTLFLAGGFGRAAYNIWRRDT